MVAILSRFLGENRTGCVQCCVACRYVIKRRMLMVWPVVSTSHLLIGVNVTPPYQLDLSANINVVFGKFCIVSARRYQVSELRECCRCALREWVLNNHQNAKTQWWLSVVWRKVLSDTIIWKQGLNWWTQMASNNKESIRSTTATLVSCCSTGHLPPQRFW